MYQLAKDFIPIESSHWRQEVIDLSSFQNQKILLKFVTTNLRGNNIFIDNIEINNNISNLKLFDNDIKIFPNPSSNLFTINCKNCVNKNIIIEDILGNIVFRIKVNSDKQNINFSDKKNGMYFLRIENNQNIFPIIKI